MSNKIPPVVRGKEKRLNDEFSKHSSIQPTRVNDVTYDNHYDREALREHIRSLSGHYILGENNGRFTVCQKEKKPQTIYEYIKAFFYIRTAAEKQAYREGVDAARRRIAITYYHDASVLSRFDEEFIKPKKILLFSFSSRWEMGSPLSGDALLRFIEKEEAIRLQSEKNQPPIENKVFTSEEQHVLYNTARSLQERWQDHFFTLSREGDYLEQQAIQAHWLGLVYFGNDEFSSAIKKNEQAVSLLYKKYERGFLHAIRKSNEIDIRIGKAIEENTWSELAAFLQGSDVPSLGNLTQELREVDRVMAASISSFSKTLQEHLIQAKAERDDYYVLHAKNKRDNVYIYADKVEKLNKKIIEAEKDVRELANKIVIAEKIARETYSLCAEFLKKKLPLREDLAVAWSLFQEVELPLKAKEPLFKEYTNKVMDAQSSLFAALQESEQLVEKKQQEMIPEMRRKNNPLANDFNFSNELEAKSPAELDAMMKEYSSLSDAFSEAICNQVRMEQERRSLWKETGRA